MVTGRGGEGDNNSSNCDGGGCEFAIIVTALKVGTSPLPVLEPRSWLPHRASPGPEEHGAWSVQHLQPRPHSSGQEGGGRCALHRWEGGRASEGGHASGSQRDHDRGGGRTAGSDLEPRDLMVTDPSRGFPHPLLACLQVSTNRLFLGLAALATVTASWAGRRDWDEVPGESLW